MKMAAVFMTSTSAISLRARILPLWMALFGFARGVNTPIERWNHDWAVLVFPLWVFLISAHILIDNFRGGSRVAAAE